MEAYHAGGLAPPARVEWYGGPLELARERERLVALGEAGESIKPAVLTTPLRAVDRAIRDAVAPSVLFQIRQAARPFGASPLSRAVVSAVAADTDFGLTQRTVTSRLLGWIMRRGLQTRAEESLTEAGLSQHDAPPFYVYAYLRDELGLRRIVDRLNGLLQVAAHVGWFVPHERICFVAERHDVLRLDANGRLHAADGPALRYPDRWSRYFWKGIELSPWMIEQPDWLELNRIEREPDPVIRHCLVDILTPERFIGRGYAKRVATDDCGVLWQHNWRLGGVWAAVEVVNGTAEPDGTWKHYFLTVPGNLRSARQAVAWTYGLNEWEYDALKVRT